MELLGMFGIHGWRRHGALAQWRIYDFVGGKGRAPKARGS